MNIFKLKFVNNHIIHILDADKTKKYNIVRVPNLWTWKVGDTISYVDGSKWKSLRDLTVMRPAEYTYDLDVYVEEI